MTPVGVVVTTRGRERVKDHSWQGFLIYILMSSPGEKIQLSICLQALFLYSTCIIVRQTL